MDPDGRRYPPWFGIAALVLPAEAETRTFASTRSSLRRSLSVHGLLPPEIEKFITWTSPCKQDAVHAGLNVGASDRWWPDKPCRANVSARRHAGDLAVNGAGGVGGGTAEELGVASSGAGRVRAVAVRVSRVRAIAEPPRSSRAGTIQSSDQLVWRTATPWPQLATFAKEG